MESEQRIEESIRELADRRAKIETAIKVATRSLREIDKALADLEAQKAQAAKARTDGEHT